MTAAELRIIRERLGVTGDWLAARLGVIPRTVRRWEAGTRAISAQAADHVRAELAAQDGFVAEVAAAVTADPWLDEHGEQWSAVYPNDAALQVAWPGVWYPAGWHRAAMGRVADLVPGLRLRFPTEPVERDDDG